MQLRDKLQPHWPPAWGSAHTPGEKLAISEDGVLVDARIGREQPTGEENLVLEIDHEGSRYSGVLIVKEAGLRARVLKSLEANKGRAIREIGSLDI